MSIIRYITGDILKPKPYPRIIIHSCNCNGSWGGGIAYQLAVKYPEAETVYMNHCTKYGSKLLGSSLLIPSFKDSDVLIACLFTSSFGGSSHDHSSSILRYTEEAINDLINTIATEKGGPIYGAELQKPLTEYELELPKINSGIFGVPWELTEQVLKKYTGNISFNVYTF
ncbi:hypothetical protein NCAS_0A10220 [Naumovozyma castellii]|uniref:ADP-ribose 1''-phosphate phosphatase n=1 Tax=Naumovozyma castellii TaxID=27288 RepID=G0V7Y2_NAUCA|nr:hypothetical protein NCAS_0A10220 [Naumovozyma castellii CBS 4309]CCC67580.1 hypothetical protein NCAS_0A10220 [Naumovozyma castellii CBS 4309]